MIRCNTSISLITVTVDGWLAGCTGEAGDTRGVCTGGTAAATTIIDEAFASELQTCRERTGRAASGGGDSSSPQPTFNRAGQLRADAFGRLGAAHRAALRVAISDGVLSALRMC
jgi:hypothetical protein